MKKKILEYEATIAQQSAAMTKSSLEVPKSDRLNSFFADNKNLKKESYVFFGILNL